MIEYPIRFARMTKDFLGVLRWRAGVFIDTFESLFFNKLRHHSKIFAHLTLLSENDADVQRTAAAQFLLPAGGGGWTIRARATFAPPPLFAFAFVTCSFFIIHRRFANVLENAEIVAPKAL
jgi:hypothetical protein